MGLSGVVAADELCPSDSSRDIRVRQLETRITALEAQEASASADRAAIVDAILRDAERRSTLLANSENAAAGYDDGFFIRTGSFEFRPSLFAIFRNTTSWVEHPLNPNQEEGFDNGFELRRVELEFEGTVFSPQLWYDFVWKVPSNGGEPILDEAFATYGFADTRWALKAGQFKDHVYQEETVSSKRQLAAERSVLNELLMGGCFDRVQGVAVLYGDLNTPLHAEGSFHDGAASFNTPFTDSPTDSAATADFGMTGRLDWKLMGDWKNYRDFSARDTKDDLLVLGLGTDWTQGEFLDGADPAVGGDRYFSALDAQWELAGPKIGIFAALVSDYTRFNDGLADDRLNWGTLFQTGWALNPQWELFARYDLVRLDEAFLVTQEDTVQEITAGVNYYLGRNGSAGDRAKFTVDVGYLPDGSPIAIPNIGIPAASESNIVYIRAQMQLVI
jgi:hypothetical protein